MEIDGPQLECAAWPASGGRRAWRARARPSTAGGHKAAGVNRGRRSIAEAGPQTAAGPGRADPPGLAQTPQLAAAGHG